MEEKEKEKQIARNQWFALQVPAEPPRWYVFLFPIILNRLNLHVTMATTTDGALFWDIRIRGGILASSWLKEIEMERQRWIWAPEPGHLRQPIKLILFFECKWLQNKGLRNVIYFRGKLREPLEGFEGQYLHAEYKIKSERRIWVLLEQYRIHFAKVIHKIYLPR